MTRLLIGSIFAGFILSNSMPPMTTPLMAMPLYLKLTALMVTTLGFILAFEINTYSKNLKYPYPSDSTKFSTLLGYFPTIMHRLPPHLVLTMSQKFATSLLDLAWTETILPKTMALIQLKASTLTSNQKGLIKLYFLSFLITMTLCMLLFNYPE